jgi:hypothetical protein
LRAYSIHYSADFNLKNIYKTKKTASGKAYNFLLGRHRHKATSTKLFLPTTKIKQQTTT